MTEHETSRTEIDQLAARFYGAFCQRDGHTADPRSVESLFVPGALIVRCSMGEPEIMDLEEFLAPRDKILRDGTLTGFEEVEIEAVTVVHGNLAQRSSQYRKWGRRSGVAFAGKGHKLFQLVQMPKGWRIVSFVWEDKEE